MRHVAIKLTGALVGSAVWFAGASAAGAHSSNMGQSNYSGYGVGGYQQSYVHNQAAQGGNQYQESKGQGSTNFGHQQPANNQQHMMYSSQNHDTQSYQNQHQNDHQYQGGYQSQSYGKMHYGQTDSTKQKDHQSQGGYQQHGQMYAQPSAYNGGQHQNYHQYQSGMANASYGMGGKNQGHEQGQQNYAQHSYGNMQYTGHQNSKGNFDYYPAHSQQSYRAYSKQDYQYHNSYAKQQKGYEYQPGTHPAHMFYGNQNRSQDESYGQYYSGHGSNFDRQHYGHGAFDVSYKTPHNYGYMQYANYERERYSVSVFSQRYSYGRMTNEGYANCGCGHAVHYYGSHRYSNDEDDVYNLHPRVNYGKGVAYNEGGNFQYYHHYRYGQEYSQPVTVNAYSCVCVCSPRGYQSGYSSYSKTQYTSVTTYYAVYTGHTTKGNCGQRHAQSSYARPHRYVKPVAVVHRPQCYGREHDIDRHVHKSQACGGQNHRSAHGHYCGHAVSRCV